MGYHTFPGSWACQEHFPDDKDFLFTSRYLSLLCNLHQAFLCGQNSIDDVSNT